MEAIIFRNMIQVLSVGSYLLNKNNSERLYVLGYQLCPRWHSKYGKQR